MNPQPSESTTLFTKSENDSVPWNWALSTDFLHQLPNLAFSYGVAFSHVVSYEGLRDNVQTHTEIVNTAYNAIEKEWQMVTVAATEAKFISKASLSTSYLRLVAIFLSFLLIWILDHYCKLMIKILVRYTSFQWLETRILETCSSTILLQPEIKGFQESNQAIYILDEKHKG